MRTIALCVKQVIKKHVLPLLFCKSFDDGGHDDDIDNDLYIKQHPVVRVVPTQGLQNEPGEQAGGGRGGQGGRGQARARGVGG